MYYFSEIKCFAELPTPEVIIYEIISCYSSRPIYNTYFCIASPVNYGTISTLI
jgi:hypothetical protein